MTREQRAALEKLSGALLECETCDVHELLSDDDQWSFDNLQNAIQMRLSEPEHEDVK